MMDMEQARFNMIEQQIRPWDVLDHAVLQVMSDLPRDRFVSEAQQALAYADIQLPLGHGELMMHPRVEGRILQELTIQDDDICLEIGTGSGYLTACMANLAKEVYSVELHQDLLEVAKKRLAAQNISNVILEQADALQSLDLTKRYDVIAVTGSVPEYLPLFEQLLQPNGRLYITVGSGVLQYAMLVVRSENKYIQSQLFATELTPLHGARKTSNFSF
jgi:protein-L-isoaspartate(D-aspartate) O-methyltransferase